MSHPWRSPGAKRTLVWEYSPPEEIVTYLANMQDAISYSLHIAYKDSIRKGGRIPSPIQLRREIRDWFYSRYEYARHHINPVCRTAVAMLRSYKKNHQGELRIPELKRIAMRIDGELFRLVGDGIRVTLQPKSYAWIPINAENKHFQAYSKGRPTELLITDKRVCLTFATGQDQKRLGEKLLSLDLNFGTVDSTRATIEEERVKVERVETEPIETIARIQSDFSRRRTMLQKHIKIPQKRRKKLRETRGRQRNRIKDVLHKLTTEVVGRNPRATFVFEDLKGIRRSVDSKGRRFRTCLNRWPFKLYQSFVEYKSPNITLYVDPRGTSSECPACGGRLEHPTWAVSRCVKCGVDYDRNRLASLAILCRGLRLCGQPFAVSADASWQHLRSEYLHTRSSPEVAGTGWTEHAVDAPNLDECNGAPTRETVSPR